MKRPTRIYRFDQVDVFADRLGDGNAVAIIHGADELRALDMLRIARWTNLAETVFLMRPSGGADYRARIFTSTGELPFAGHPTLGAAYAWSRRTGSRSTTLVQECGAGEVLVRRDGLSYGFNAPSPSRTGRVDAATRRRVLRALNLNELNVRDVRWGALGPEWILVLAVSSDAVRAIVPNFVSADSDVLGLAIGVLGPDAESGDFEARAFLPGDAMPEDPATGSLAAAFAQWLVPAGRAPMRYTVRQGRSIGRDASIRVTVESTGTWIWGEVTPGITGTLKI